MKIKKYFASLNNIITSCKHVSSRKFVYVIYDEVTGEVWECFLNEDLCIDRYNERYKGFVNMNWMGINIEFEVKRRVL